MKRIISNLKLSACVLTLCFFSSYAIAQTAEWRLVFVNYSGTDPDGEPGPGLGSAQFKLQVHAQSGTIAATNISTGFSFQSSKIILPLACAGVAPFPNNPSNIILSPAFIAAGYSYNTVNLCLPVTETTGGQTFDRRVNGTLENGNITLTIAWVDAFTATLWTQGTTAPQGGYVMINSGEGGTPGTYNTYTISDADGNAIPTNSLTFTTPLALGSAPLPVLFTKFDARCVDNGTMIIWGTATESNSSHFEVERSTNGIEYVTIGNIRSSGNSTIQKNYQYLDLNGGNAFYRLKQVDLDGHNTYTISKHTNCDGKQVTVVLYPVPVKDKLNVVIKSNKLFKTELQVFDISGRIVKRVPTTINNGNNSITINVNNLAAGEYILRSTEPTIQINRKFVIAR